MILGRRAVQSKLRLCKTTLQLGLFIVDEELCTALS